MKPKVGILPKSAPEILKLRSISEMMEESAIGPRQSLGIEVSGRGLYLLNTTLSPTLSIARAFAAAQWLILPSFPIWLMFNHMSDAADSKFLDADAGKNQLLVSFVY